MIVSSKRFSGIVCAGLLLAAGLALRLGQREARPPGGPNASHDIEMLSPVVSGRTRIGAAIPPDAPALTATSSVSPDRSAPPVQTAVTDRYAEAVSLAEAIQAATPSHLRRYRLVKTDFKYPFVRLDETHVRDPESGDLVLVRQESVVGDHVLVRMDDGFPADSLANLVAGANAHIRQRLSFPDTYLVAVDDPTPGTVEMLIGFLTGKPGIRYAEPDAIVTRAAVVPNDPDYGQQWHLPKIGMPGAWTQGTGNHEVVVAVIDTGVDYLHPDLAANMWVNPGEAANGLDNDGNGFIDDIHGWNFYHKDNNPMDIDSAHGTHIAGIIGAVGNNRTGTAGICWTVSIMALRFFDDTGQNGAISDVVSAIHYANKMRRSHGVNVRAINASWGGPHNQTVADAIAASQAEGILVVAAAGNNSRDIDTYPYYPASYPNANVIAVANTTSADGLAGLSSYGRLSVHLGAPGSFIHSTLINGRYGSKSGTSMAAPMVSGAVALLWSLDPSLSMGQVKEALLAGVDPLPALAGKTVTGGRLNVARAAQAATVAVVHQPHGETFVTNAVYPLTVWVEAGVAVPDDGVEVLWRTRDDSTFSAITMSRATTQDFSGAIPPQPLGSRIEYRIRVISMDGWIHWHPGEHTAHAFDIKRPDPPHITTVSPPVQATDGSGFVTWAMDIADPYRRTLELDLHFSTDGGNWNPAPIALFETSTGTFVPLHEGPRSTISINTAEETMTTTNRVTVMWDSRDDDTIGESASVVLEARLRDGLFWDVPLVSPAFSVDNVAPSAEQAVLTLQTSRFGPYILTNAVHVAWEGFTDAGSGIGQYFVAPADGGGSANGVVVTGANAVVDGLIYDDYNTIFVWAADRMGNIGPSASASILVLNPAGDYDGNGISNRDEEIAGTDATDRRSAFQLRHQPAAVPEPDGGVILQWPTVTGRFYSLRETTQLNAPIGDWPIVPSVSNVPGTGGNMTYTGQTEAAGMRFYRIEVTP